MKKMLSIIAVVIGFAVCARAADTVLNTAVPVVNVTVTNVVTYTNTTTYSTNFVYVTNSATVYVTNTYVRATGQHTSYSTGDDGDHEKGVAWPNPRFTIGTGADTNLVTDNLTGLTWNRSSNTNTFPSWSDAVAFCAALSDGHEGWRLPNYVEMMSIIDFGWDSPSTPNTSGSAHQTADGAPFFNFPAFGTILYWTSTTMPGNSLYTYAVSASNGQSAAYFKNGAGIFGGAWPVRGGN